MNQLSFRICVWSAAIGVASLLVVFRAAADDPPPSKTQDDKPPTAENPTVKDANKPDAQSPAEPVKPPTPPSSEQAVIGALLGNLTPQHMKFLGSMLDEDWKDRPEWGEMAVAILKGDYMRPGAGWWKPGTKRYDWNWIHQKFDSNDDGKIDRDEFPSDVGKADQLFDRLDRDGDGQLTPADFDFAEPAGMNMAAMKNMMSNQLFSRLDKDSNGRITLDEIAAFFGNADKEELGFLTPEDLRSAIDDPPSKKSAASDSSAREQEAGPFTPASALRMFLRSELGWLTPGPKIDDDAPDFELPTQEGISAVKLSNSFGKRPVVLIFGSFT